MGVVFLGGGRPPLFLGLNFGDLGPRNLSQTSGFLKRSPDLHSHRNPTNFDPFHKVLGRDLKNAIYGVGTPYHRNSEISVYEANFPL